MIDLHSHLLPSIDDGSRSATQSLEVLERFRAEGVTDVVLTPHLSASMIAQYGETAVARREEALDELKEVLPDRSPDGRIPNLHLGFEIMLDEPLPRAGASDRRFSLAGSRYYLVEFPPGVAGHIATALLARMIGDGVVPIVAHPERYQACSPEQVAEWRGTGARIQVDATTVTRPTARGHRARDLLRNGLADVLSADNHGDSRTVTSAVRYLKEERGLGGTGERIIDLLTAQNPRAVLDDQPMKEAPRAPLDQRFLARVKRALRGL